MKFIIVVFALTLFGYANAKGVTTLGMPSIHPDHPGKCWIQYKHLILSPGEVHIGECSKFECDKNLNYAIHSCANIVKLPGCTVTRQDNSKPYPDCCPDLVCTPQY